MTDETLPNASTSNTQFALDRQSAHSLLPWLPFPWLSHLQELGILRPMDVEFAQFFAQQQHSKFREAACLIAALLSAQVGRKHLCIAIDSINPIDPFYLGNAYVGPKIPVIDNIPTLLTELNGVEVIAQSHFEQSHLEQSQPVPSINALLIVQRGNLYMARYWHYENNLANDLLERQRQKSPIDLAIATQWLERLFGPTCEQIDWQKMACAVASLNQFSVITGGPGTGKTTC